jgi:hypothetical protein
MSMQQSNNPSDILNEGMTRAKNMAIAAAMIVFLLTKFFFVKIVWKRLQSGFAWVVVKSAILASKAWVKLQPHWERFKAYVAETKVKVVRTVLSLLIVALTPLENSLLKATGIAKAHSEAVAHKSAMTIAQTLVVFFNAIGTGMKAGFSRPAMQKMMARLLELVDEASK